MQRLLTGLGLGALLVLIGCNHVPWSRDQPRQVGAPQGKPTAAQLVRYLNDSTQRISGMECEVDIDAKSPEGPIGLLGRMACERPRNFRLTANVVGQPGVDLGSNYQEFWFWIGKANPNVFHCSYEDFRRGAGAQFPFQPEWIMEALGMAEYDPNKEYSVQEKGATVELIERSISPQGKPVQKVVVFSRTPAAPGKPQVLAHLLLDANGKEICAARIDRVQLVRLDQYQAAVVPQQVELRWPEQQTKLTLKLKDIKIAPFPKERAEGLFTRRALSSLPSIDLARGPNASAGPLQPVGGTMPR
jgi:hypothetical protein